MKLGLGIKGILYLTFFLFIAGTVNVIAQQLAMVSVEEANFRLYPSTDSRIIRKLAKGTRIEVSSPSAKGWSFVVHRGTYGYLHISTFKIVNDWDDSIAGAVVVPPKYIIVGEEEERISKKEKVVPKLENLKSSCAPPNYCPSIDNVFSSLVENSDKFQKGKFEKTAEWESRMLTVLREIPLTEGRVASDKLTFLFEPYSSFLTDPQPVYDADKETWTFKLDFETANQNTCIPVFGTASGSVYCLTADTQLSDINLVTVSMSPALAKANDGMLFLAFIGTIVDPYYWVNSNAPASQIPSGIYFNITKIVCLNPHSGKNWEIRIPGGKTFESILKPPRSKSNLNDQ